MSTVDWSYHRKNCDSCAKTAAFLEKHKITVKTQVDARSTALTDADALQLIDDAKQLYVTRGTKVLHYDLAGKRPDNDVLLEQVIGRSGKLRAPTLKVGKTVIVGFDQATYEKIF